MRGRLAVTLVLLTLAACGDKVPQSEASRRVGEAPKQVIDKATDDTRRALEQASPRSREAD